MSPTAGTAVAARPVTPLGILSARLDDVARRLAESGSDVDPALVAELADACDLARGLDPYLDVCTTPDSAALVALEERTRAAAWGDPSGPGGSHHEQEMLSGHVEGQLLKLLVHATRARRVLDVGMFTGYSALAMAEALPPEGRVVACELDAEVAAFAQECFAASPDAGKVDVRVGPALETLRGLAAQASAGERFELIFVDADKPGYESYLEAILDGGLLAAHGLVCVDNTLMQGEPWTTARSSGASVNGTAIAIFNQAVAADPRVEQVLLPLRDGLTLIRVVGSPVGEGEES